MSEVKSTAEACYDARMALIKERDELTQQISAYQLSQQNIINAFGISGEGAHSKLVIEYVHGLVAENAKLAEEVMSYARECDRITYYKDNKITDAHQTDAAKDIEAASINTDGAIAEIKASELDDLARSIMEYAPVIESDEYHVYEVIAKDVTDRATNLRAGRKG